MMLVAAGACGGGRSGRAPDPAPAVRPTFTLFALAELRGQIEPCGCTTDPLGDLSRTTALVEAARAEGPVLVVDAGSTLFSSALVADHLVAQDRLKADLILDTFEKRLQVAAMGLGPNDVAMGAEAIKPPRQAVNVAQSAGGAPIEAPKLVPIGGTQVGILGAVAPGMVPGIEAAPPGPAATAAAADLRKRGATIVVALLQAQDRRSAIEMLRSIQGVDIAIAGLGGNTPEPDKISPTADRVGDAWLVIPANRGQVLSRIDVTVRPGQGPLVDAIGPGAAQLLRQGLAGRIRALTEEIAAFEKSADADPAFVAQKKQELAEARAEDTALAATPLRPPAQGSYFALTQIRIVKGLACDVPVQEAKFAYNKAAGAANVAAAASVKAPEPPRGQASYVGAEACADCHAEADEFWQRTKHVKAWETLEVVGKQFDYSCIGCHVTGWDQPGGATLAHNEALRDVQCETCHGPGSIHVDKMGKERPFAVKRAPAEGLCASQCHTPDHSDTFDYTAYLRDIVGPGHGEAVRNKLGDGPTGQALRAAGLAKAGSQLGAGCVK